MALPGELPLIPLNVVLFPGMPLPLHIFEERYKLMINRCVADGRPFGVALIRSGSEVGGPAMPHPVGTTAVVTHVDRLAEGRLNIATVGCERYRLVGIARRTPYLVGRIEPYPLVEDVDAASDCSPLRDLLARYVERLARLVREDYQGDCLPEDPLTLACLAGIVLQVGHAEKQRLLEAASLSRLLSAEQVLLRRELCLLDFMARGEPAPARQFSSN
jgi:Lon protease-like protein